MKARKNSRAIATRNRKLDRIDRLDRQLDRVERENRKEGRFEGFLAGMGLTALVWIWQAQLQKANV